MQASGPSSTLSAHWQRRYGLRRMICRRRNKLGKWGVLTNRFRGEEYLFRRNRGRDDVKLVEKVPKASSFAITGQVQVEISSFARSMIFATACSQTNQTNSIIHTHRNRTMITSTRSKAKQVAKLARVIRRLVPSAHLSFFFILPARS